MPQEPPISVADLEEIICGDRDFLRELVDQFWSDLDQRLPQLQASVSQFDGPNVALIAHTIAGSAGCIGAERLRLKAKLLETCGQQRQSHEAVSLLVSLEEEIELVRAFFLAY